MISSSQHLPGRKGTLALAGVAALLLLGSVQLRAQTAANLPEGKGKQLLATACSQCHSLKPVLMLRRGAAGWKTTVDEMILHGAQLMPQEADTVVQYLARNFGPGSKPLQNQSASQKAASSRTGTAAEAVSLPAGPGKELVESQCTLCHGLDRVTEVKKTKQEWTSTVKNMVELGLSATPEQIQTITSYLEAHFGK